MMKPRANAFYARSLLGAALVWVFGVTVCSTRAAEMPGAVPHDHAEHAGPGDHEHGAAPHDHGESDDCACASFNSFPTELATLAKAPVPALALLYTILPEEIFVGSVQPSIETQNTGPPERVALSERNLARLQLNHAPPPVG